LSFGELLLHISGHLSGCGDADLHNSLTSASSASLEHFPHKTEKNAKLVIKQLLSILTNIKAKGIDFFEVVFLLNINENTPLRSRVILNLQVFHASGDEPGY